MTACPECERLRDRLARALELLAMAREKAQALIHERESRNHGSVRQS